MKKFLILLFLVAFSQAKVVDVMEFSIDDALKSELAKKKLGGVEFKFEAVLDAEILKPNLSIQRRGKIFKNNKYGSMDPDMIEMDFEKSCHRVFISNLIVFQQEATYKGARRVVNLKSPNGEFNGKFSCTIARMSVVVDLVGDLAK